MRKDETKSFMKSKSYVLKENELKLILNEKDNSSL